jgi:hypothetical protein
MGNDGKTSRLSLYRAGYAPSGKTQREPNSPPDSERRLRLMPAADDPETKSKARYARLQTLALLFVLIASPLTYAWVRTRDLDRAVTVDEPVFLTISANFANALAHHHFRDTNQFLYPAVTIMWAGSIGFMIDAPDYTKDYPRQVEPLDAINNPLRSVGYEPLKVLDAAREVKIAFQACIFLIGLWLMYRLFGIAVTALAAAFIVFDPFLVAHDQLLHVDGLTGITAFVSMLAAATADRDRAYRWWALAGVMAALCWLTRLTGFVLLPIFLFLITDRVITDYRHGDLTGKGAATVAARTAGLVVAVSVLTTFIVWPALWVDPVSTIRVTLKEWQSSISTPHPWGLFFQGKTVTGDPGILFYVYVFLYKITPITLAGLSLTAFALLFRIKSFFPQRSWRSVLILTIFVIVYSVGMAAGERKFDRYILPIFLFVDLFAAIGFIGLVRLLWGTPTIAWRIATAVLVVGLVAGQVDSTLAQRPYPLDYYNPLMGGTKSAEKTVMVGWGEGFDQAANFILAKPGGNTAAVRVSTRPSSMQYYFPDTATVQNLFALQADRHGILDWANTDYAVIHILQLQRETSGRIVHYFDNLTPVHTVFIDDIPFVKVYDLRDIPPPAWMIQENPCSWKFGDQITLADYGPHQPEAGENHAQNERMIEIIFSTSTDQKLPSSYLVKGSLQPRKGKAEPINFSTTFVPNPQPGMLAKAVQSIQIPKDKKLSDYWLTASVTNPKTGETLGAVRLTNGEKSKQSGQPSC